MTSLPDLNDGQRELLSYLPANADELSTNLGLSRSGLYSKIKRLRETLNESETDAALKHDGEVYHLTGEETSQVRQLSTRAKSTKTRKANQFRTEMEAAILRRLEHKEPLRSHPEFEQGTEDLALGMGDLHFGDVVTVSGGREVYNPQLAYASVVEMTRKAISLKGLEDDIVDFQNAHVFWTGDMVTGEQIYERQGFDIGAYSADQITMAVEALVHQVETPAAHFETVTVTAVPGNHGLDSASAKSKQANQDLNVYRWVADRLIDRGHDNIDFKISQGRHYVNREIRDHRYHMRHGQDEQLHADATARSESDQRGLLHAHGFDVQIRGHHHTKREADVLNDSRVITLPSPKPGGDFAERIGRPDISVARSLGMLWRISDKRPITGKYDIDDLDLDLDELDVPSTEDIRSRYGNPNDVPHAL